jgi:hypothetical protein
VSLFPITDALRPPPPLGARLAHQRTHKGCATRSATCSSDEGHGGYSIKLGRTRPSKGERRDRDVVMSLIEGYAESTRPVEAFGSSGGVRNATGRACMLRALSDASIRPDLILGALAVPSNAAAFAADLGRSRHALTGQSDNDVLDATSLLRGLNFALRSFTAFRPVYRTWRLITSVSIPVKRSRQPAHRTHRRAPRSPRIYTEVRTGSGTR